MSFHIENLRQNGFDLKTNQIKWLLQKIREAKYPANEIYMKDISKITISFDNNISMKNLPLCYKFINTINPDKNNNQEIHSKAIYLSFNFQIKYYKKNNLLIYWKFIIYYIQNDFSIESFKKMHSDSYRRYF